MDLTSQVDLQPMDHSKMQDLEMERCSRSQVGLELESLLQLAEYWHFE
jgi:hypothetical protein